MLIRPQSRRSPIVNVAAPIEMPAPVGGLNAEDSITDMPAQDALVLDNFFPRPDYVELRGGFEAHGTGLGAPAETLMEWSGPSSQKLFSAAGSAIYDVSSSGSGSSSLTSLSNARWYHTMQATSGGNFLVICNGADSVRAYDGSSWSTPSITNVTSSNLDYVALHKSRLWFVQKNSLDAWYLPVESIAGAAAKFPLGSVFNRGGKLVAIASMSKDGGSGSDDDLYFFSSHGEVARYQGTDPSSASTWALVGVYNIPAPVGRRCVRSIGGDLAVITQGGVVSIVDILPRDSSSAQKSAVTAKINSLITDDARTYGSNYGWEVMTYPRSNMLLVNVPTSTNQAQRQYVMNTLTGAWCRFTGINANSFGLLNEELYFGGNDGKVYKADTGFQDDGLAIEANLKTAFSSHARGRVKAAQQMRCLYSSNGSPGVLMSVNTNYGDVAPSTSPGTGTATTNVWGTATWGGSQWNGGDLLSENWVGAAGIGHTFSIRLSASSSGSSLKVFGFDLIATAGGMV